MGVGEERRGGERGRKVLRGKGEKGFEWFCQESRAGPGKKARKGFFTLPPVSSSVRPSLITYIPHKPTIIIYTHIPVFGPSLSLWHHQTHFAAECGFYTQENPSSSGSLQPILRNHAFSNANQEHEVWRCSIHGRRTIRIRLPSLRI